ncbi:hypothetical protein DFQ29_009426 [Apophysomyces sp. BC1021]|nr:hypothetical protein DFQ29_009426 [Apophysomyces sp. BC1021]
MGHVRYIMKIVFVFIFVLFMDSVNRLKTIHEAVMSEEEAGSAHDIRVEAGFAAKKFYAQRNMQV